MGGRWPDSCGCARRIVDWVPGMVPGAIAPLPRASRLRACASVGIIKDTRDNKKYQNHTHPQSVIHATLARNVQDGICQCASVPGNSIGALVSLVNDEVDTASPSELSLRSHHASAQMKKNASALTHTSPVKWVFKLDTRHTHLIHKRSKMRRRHARRGSPHSQR
jgi:hypothetical protein